MGRSVPPVRPVELVRADRPDGQQLMAAEVLQPLLAAAVQLPLLAAEARLQLMAAARSTRAAAEPRVFSSAGRPRPVERPEVKAARPSASTTSPR